MLKKLRWRFVLINMSLILAMLLVIFSMVFGFTQRDLNRQADGMLQTVTEIGPSYRVDIPLPFMVLDINLWGDITYTTSSVVSMDITKLEGFQQLLQQVLTAREPRGYLPQYSLRYQLTAGMTYQRVVFLDVSGHEAALDSIVETCIGVGVFALGAFLIISFLLAKWAVAPVDRAWKAQKQFVSDASHELKTPLTVIMSNAELLSEEECSPEDRRKYAAGIYTGAQRMKGLANGLLELARADNGQTQAAFAPVSLTQLAQQGAMVYESILFESGLTLQTAIAENITVNGSAQHLGQLIDILLDNARKYACPGICFLSLERHGRNQCLLSLSSPGNPIPKGEMEKIFQRFYRVDSARSQTEGYGLGLSIAREIVQGHKGKIWAQSNPTGNCFFVLIPCL